MPLFEIHIHVKGAEVGDIEQLKKILMSKADEINSKLDRQDAAIAGVSQDIKYVKQKLSEASENGLTAEEAQALDARVGAIADKLEALDAETESTPEETPGPETEA
jgi:peptidoglycan hydrolase CwlO-like protein